MDAFYAIAIVYRRTTFFTFEIEVIWLVVDFTKYVLGKSEFLVFPHSENEYVKRKNWF